MSPLKSCNQNEGGMHIILPSCSKKLEQGQQAGRPESLFHRPGLKSCMRSSGSTWKAQGRAGAAAKGLGLQESKAARLCSLIPGVPGVHSCPIQAQRPPTLPSSLLPHSRGPREISSCLASR